MDKVDKDKVDKDKVGEMGGGASDDPEKENYCCGSPRGGPCGRPCGRDGRRCI